MFKLKQFKQFMFVVISFIFYVCPLFIVSYSTLMLQQKLWPDTHTYKILICKNIFYEKNIRAVENQ